MGRESVIKYLLQIDESKEDAVVPESEVYEAEVLKITRTEQAEMNQDFFDQYFGKDQVSNEDEAREKIEEVLKEHFDREATNLVNREMMHKLVELNKFDLPAEFLKKWITREQEMTNEQLETFLEELKWRVIKKKLVKQHEIKVEENEILEHFVQMIRNYSPYIDEASLKNTVFSLMKNREQVNKAVEAVSSGKLFDVLRGIVEIKDKEVARDAFNKRVKEINEMAG
jgi:trigger factor